MENLCIEGNPLLRMQIHIKPWNGMFRLLKINNLIEAFGNDVHTL